MKGFRLLGYEACKAMEIGGWKSFSNNLAEHTASPVDGIYASRSLNASAIRNRLFSVALPLAVLAIPGVAYFALIYHYGVNTVAVDQWRDVELVGKAHSGHLSFGALWAQHNENRILVPNLLVMLLAYTTNLNVHIEEYLGGVFMVAAVALVIWTHRRRCPGTPLLWYLPVAVLMLTWSQFENTLWGFQIAWYLVMLCLAGAVAVLDRDSLGPPALAAAMLIAVIGSFSSIQGLFIWLTGLILLLYRRRGWQFVSTWAVAAVATAVVYFYHLDLSRSAVGADRVSPLAHPLFLLKVYVFSLGNVTGPPLPTNVFVTPTESTMRLGQGSAWITGFGTVILVAAVLAIWRTGLVRAKDSARPVGVALIAFALIFDASIAVGRGVFGYAGVSFSRYVTFNVLALVGVYLVAISRPSAADEGWSADHASSGAGGVQPRGSGRFQWRRVASAAFLAAVLASVAVQAIFGTYNGLSGARKIHKANLDDDRMLRAYPSDSHRIVSTVLFGDAQLLYLVQIAHDERLSTFASR